MSDENVTPSNGLPIVDPTLFFCDLVSVNIAGDGETLELAFGSGGVIVKRFAFTRAHLKRLTVLLGQKIDEFDALKRD